MIRRNEDYMATDFVAYIDASGHPRDGAMLVTGSYISSAESWRLFETEWNQILSKYKVPYFHRNKFISRNGPFSDAKWKREDLCTGFLAELIGSIGRAGCSGVVTLLPLADWGLVNREYCLEEERFTPFSVTGCMSITGAYEWCKGRGVPFDQVEFIFEDGDEDKGDLIHWTHKAWGITPLFKSKTAVPLQACDFLAGEARRAELDAMSAEDGTSKVRKCFQNLLSKIPHDDARWDANTLRGLCKKHNVKRR
jgi:hypothetical protein